MTVPSAEELAARAEHAERTGRPRDAAELWGALVQAYPGHPKALFIQGRRRVEQGDPAGMTMLAQAEAADSSNPDVPLFLAMAHRSQGKLNEALAAIDRALALDPYYFMAQLSKGALLEQMGHPRQAARTYSNALKIAPAEDRMPAALRAPYERARAVVSGNSDALAEHLRARTAATRARYAGAELARFDESLDVLAGLKRVYVQEASLYTFPRLPAIPFYDRALFPWLAELEAATDAIRAELDVVMREDQHQFAPYIQKRAGDPLNQWAELNNSNAWSSFFFWKDGVRQDANCARCPNTTALLEKLPLAHQLGYGPTAMFSVLAPKTHIPAHSGSTNIRLLAHLPLILPGHCRFRVGNDMRDWRMNEAWVFDDTIDHEAWNDSDKVRVIMIIDVWNPLLSEAERELASDLLVALADYNRG